MDTSKDRSALVALDVLMREFDQMRQEHATACTDAHGAAYQQHRTLMLRWSRWWGDLREMRTEMRQEFR